MASFLVIFTCVIYDFPCKKLLIIPKALARSDDVDILELTVGENSTGLELGLKSKKRRDIHTLHFQNIPPRISRIKA